MLKTVISPQKQKLETLPQAIEEWMDAVRTYEKRKDSTGQRAAISDEIKMAALEANASTGTRVTRPVEPGKVRDLRRSHGRNHAFL